MSNGAARGAWVIRDTRYVKYTLKEEFIVKLLSYAV